MRDERTSSRPSLDPHGYFPTCADETCLNDADRREAIISNVAQPRDWMQYVTAEEWQEIEEEIAEIERTKSPYFFSTRAPRDCSNKRQELAQRGVFRSFARERYANGLAIWYGDGQPPWAR
jgi:hypothetical protein